MNSKKHQELVRQIEAYGLKNKLKDLAKKTERRRPFRHLPKQFSKGILIGQVAVVPRKSDGTRYTYVIADMVQAKILYNDINLKQTAIIVAHHIADGKSLPDRIISLDTQFASAIFDITNAKRMVKLARKHKNEAQEEIHLDKLEQAHALADSFKGQIMTWFKDTFST